MLNNVKSLFYSIFVTLIKYVDTSLDRFYYIIERNYEIRRSTLALWGLAVKIRD